MPNQRATADEHGRPLRFGEATGPREVAETLGAPSVAVPKPVTPQSKNPINTARTG